MWLGKVGDACEGLLFAELDVERPAAGALRAHVGGRLLVDARLRRVLHQHERRRHVETVLRHRRLQRARRVRGRRERRR